MGKREWSRLVILSGLLVCAASAVSQDSQSLDRQFQSAIAQYHAGKLAEAAAQLENLSSKVPKSFDVHELLGLIYAAQSQNVKAIEQLEIAVRLKTDSAPARTNLATALYHAGKKEPAEEQFKKALAIEPESYDANRNLGEFYIQSGKIAEAVPLLEKAQAVRPSYDNGYDLAQAYFLTGNLAQARQLIQNLAQRENTGELHSLLGQIEEKDGKFLAAANEYQTAAQMDPSEENLFNWGSELLLHRTYDPAIDVFEQAVQRYPDAQRPRIGLGMVLYSRGRYDEAVKSLLTAADLNPSDPRSYFFLFKVYSLSPGHAGDVIEAFRRFSELQPANAQAVYYYAMSLWKGKQNQSSTPDLQQIRELLSKAVALDPKLADAHAQLGNVYAEQHDYEKAIQEYRSALALNSNLPDTHYRLGIAYSRTGQQDRAQEELALYQRLRAQQMAEIDKEKAEVQQFIYAEKSTPSAKP